jgi:IMP dehydrogenase
MALMTEKRVRHLPVLEGTKVIGIISIGDLLKFIISKKELDIDQLEHYIQGR